MSADRSIVCELGWCVVKLQLDKDGLAESLTLMSPGHTSADRYAPAESVCLYDRVNIVKLRKFLVEQVQELEPSSAVNAGGPEQESVRV